MCEGRYMIRKKIASRRAAYFLLINPTDFGGITKVIECTGSKLGSDSLKDNFNVVGVT